MTRFMHNQCGKQAITASGKPGVRVPESFFDSPEVGEIRINYLLFALLVGLDHDTTVIGDHATAARLKVMVRKSAPVRAHHRRSKPFRLSQRVSNLVVARQDASTVQLPEDQVASLSLECRPR